MDVRVGEEGRAKEAVVRWHEGQQVVVGVLAESSEVVDLAFGTRHSADGQFWTTE